MRKSASRRVVYAVAAVSVPLLCSGVGQAEVAEEIYWVQPGNGSFMQPTNWDPAQVPGPMDAANFDLDLNYVVSFDQDVTTQRLRVHDGRPIFELGGNTYRVTEDDEELFSVVVGTVPADFARLILLNGTLEANRSLIGRDQWSNGVVRVEAGGRWDNQELTIGRHGSGSLSILDGGFVKSGFRLDTPELGPSVIGELAGSTGHVLVSGAGSYWEAGERDPSWWDRPAGGIVVGRGGNSTLEVRDGGEVLTGGVNIGSEAGSSGSVVVDGAGSELVGSIFFGDGGGTLDVLNGARVVGYTGQIGVNDGPAVVNVIGEGSRLGFARVGGASEGQLTAGPNATINVLHGGRLGADDVVRFRDATVTVDGAESLLHVVGAEVAPLYLQGSTVVTVSNGGHMNSMYTPMSDTASVVLEGGSWNVGASLDTSLELEDASTVTVNSGLLTTERFARIRSLVTLAGEQSQWSSQTLSVFGGTVRLSDGATGVSSVESWVSNGGLLELEGDGAHWEAPRMMVWGGNLVISDGAALSTSSFASLRRWTSDPATTVLIAGPGSLWTVDNQDEMVIGGADLTIDNGGSLSVAGSLAIQGGGADAGISGSVTVSGSGSLMEVGRLVIGREGEGRLDVLEGGRVDLIQTHGLFLAPAVSDGTPGRAVVNVIGSGSRLRAMPPGSSIVIGSTTSGEGGSSVVNVLEGGLIFWENLWMTAADGHEAVLNVRGDGSVLWGTFGVNVMRNARLEVTDGGRVNDAFKVTDGGHVTVSGAGSVVEGIHDGASLVVASGGSVLIEDGAAVLPSISQFALVGTGGTVTVRGQDSLLQTYFARFGLESGMAQVDVFDGARFHGMDTRIGETAGGMGEFQVSGSGSSFHSHLLWIGRPTAEVGDTGWGLLKIEDGAELTVTAGVIVQHRGRLEYGGAGGDLSLPSVTLAGGEMILASGGDKRLVLGPVLFADEPLWIDIAAGSRLDLADNRMLVRDGDLAEIHGWVGEGYAGGNWDGAGIMSSVAAGDSQRALGTGPSEEGVVVMFTFGGDATLDEQVDIADLGVVAANWQQSERFWHQGDFDYNGEVNIGDLGILAGNWGKGTGSPSMNFDEALAMFDAFNGVVVPEPAIVSVLGLSGLLGLRRKGGRRNRGPSL